MRKTSSKSAEVVAAVRRAIDNNRLTFVSFPEPIPERIWRRGDGELEFIDDMGLDHLKNAIQRVIADRERLLKYLEHDPDSEVVESALLPVIDRKLRELKRVFARKAKI